MFTGIISAKTSVSVVEQTDQGTVLSFKKPTGWDDLVLGESIATSGVCLTVSAIHTDSYECFVMPETLKRATFGMAIPQAVNLERAMQATDRFGGHFVQGHVDDTGIVTNIEDAEAWRLTLSFDPQYRSLVLLKGSVTIDGVALTVTELTPNTLTVDLIPHTREHTTIGSLTVGDHVNLEFDVLGKYVQNGTKEQ